MLASAFPLVVVAGGLLVAFQAAWVGQVSVSEIGREPAALVRSGAGGRVAILRSEATAQFLQSGPAYEAHPQYWQNLLRRAGWAADVISDAQLEQDLSAYQVLVLPSAVCLNENQKNAIRTFLRGGKGVVATWITGTRDEKGKWLGWEFLQELTGADALEISERPAPWFISFAADSPLTTGLAAASRVQVVSPERAAATALQVDGYWSDYRLFPVDSKLPPNFLGSVLHTPYEQRGRVAWLGFQENSAVAGGADKALLDSLLRNAVAWTAGDLVIGVAAWPAPYASAALLALNVETTRENASYAADALLRSDAKGSFYCIAQEVQQNPDLLQTLRRAGEVASHGWRHEPLAGLGKFRLAYELFASRWVLQRRSGQYISGFVPSFDALPDRAVPALAATRYRYFVTGAQGNSVLPQTVVVSQKWGPWQRERALVRLVRVGDDDLSLSPLGVTGLEQDWIVQRLAADADIIHSLGGLYILSYHTQGLSAPEYVPVLTQLVKNWKGEAVWVATGDDLANWWLKRQHLRVAASPGADGVTKLKVEYTGKEPIAGATVNIYPADDPAKLVLLPLKADEPAPGFRVDAEHGRLQAQFERLVPGTYWYELRPRP